jgi:hypothetical protein
MQVYCVGVRSLRNNKDKDRYKDIHSGLHDGVYPLTDSQKLKIDWIAIKLLIRGHL